MRQADLARRIGASTGAVSDWANDKRLPDTASCEKIADVLHVSVDTVLTRAGHRPADPFYDPDSPEAQLLPYIRAIDWTKRDRELAMIKRQLEFIAEVDRGEHDR